jgi:chromosome segregation ATPase
MKKTIITIVVFFLLIDSGIAYYLYMRQNDMAESVERSVLDEVEYRRSREESIKQELETKKRSKVFVEQQESARQMEDALVQKLDEYQRLQEQGMAALADKLEQATGDFSARFGVYNKTLEDYKKEQELYSRELKEDIAALGRSVNDDLAALGRRLTAYSVRLDEYKSALDGSRRTMEEYGSRISGLRRELEDYKVRMQELKDMQKEAADVRGQ